MTVRLRSSDRWLEAGGGAGFNVKNYGATGDGSTDDTTAIQNAITAAGSGHLHFPAGTYRITSALALGTSGLVLTGDGFQATVINQVTAGAHAFTATNKREFVFRDMKIQGQGTGTADGIYLAATGSYAVFDCEFTNLFVRNFGRDGIHTEDLCTSTFKHVRVQECGRDGFHIGDNGSSALGGTSLSFVSCYANACVNAGYYLDALAYSQLSGCATDSCNYGYYLNRSSSLQLSGCGVESTTGSAGHGFVIANGTVSCSLISCVAINIKASTGIGFWAGTLAGGGNCSRNSLINCRVSGGVTPGFSAQVDSANQAVFMGFYPHPSAANNFLGTATQIA